MGEKLPLLGTEELIPEKPANVDYGQSDRADIQHCREQERDVRGATKTIAQLALEMSHVHQLADLIKEKADLLKDLAMRRKSYLFFFPEAALWSMRPSQLNATKVPLGQGQGKLQREVNSGIICS